MNKIFATLLVFISCVPNLFAAESVSVTALYFDFDTFIRVRQSGVIETSDDKSLQGMMADYTQTLRYFANGKRAVNLNFPDQAAVVTYLNQTLCEEVHAITIKPVREAGNIGLQTYAAQLKPFTIRATGKIILSKNKDFNYLHFCALQK